jgi:hypothetical protein
MAYYSSSGAPRSRFADFMRTWFSLARWTAADGFITLAGVVLAVAVFLPWFKATVRIRGTDVTGFLMDPPGTLGGLAAHWYLLVPLAVAMLESSVIVARHFPSRRAPRLPFHRYFLVVASGVDFVAVIAAACSGRPHGMATCKCQTTSTSPSTGPTGHWSPRVPRCYLWASQSRPCDQTACDLRKKVRRHRRVHGRQQGSLGSRPLCSL